MPLSNNNSSSDWVCKYFESNKTMPFKVSDKKLLKKVHQNMGKNYHLNEKRI